MLKNKKGFTLIELLIVIVIIGILAGIVVGLVGTNARRKANDSKKKSTVHEIQNALEQYFVDHNSYPGTLEALQTSNPILLDTDIETTDYEYTTNAGSAGTATTYTLRFELENQGDTGDNVEADGGVNYYVVENKQ